MCFSFPAFHFPLTHAAQILQPPRSPPLLPSHPAIPGLWGLHERGARAPIHCTTATTAPSGAHRAPAPGRVPCSSPWLARESPALTPRVCSLYPITGTHHLVLFLLFCLSTQAGMLVPAEQGPFLVISRLYLQPPAQSLGHNRCSVNTS